MLIITTNEFTQQARDTADQLNVKLIDGERLVHLIEQHEALDLVAEYLDFIEPVEEPDSDQRTTEAPGEAVANEQPTDASTDPATASSPSTTTDSTTSGHSSTPWLTATWVCLLGWVVVILGVSVLSDLIWGVIFLGSWLGLPISIFQDARSLSDETNWPQHTWAYVLGSAIWFVSLVVGGVYLWQRRVAVD